MLNYSWRDYGNRVGVWRCLELFDELKLPAAALINTALYGYCPEVIEALPYPQELNGIPMIVARRMDASEFADMIVDNFDEMLRQCQAQPLVMGIALHPYLVGQPYRLRHLRRAPGRSRRTIFYKYPGIFSGR